MKLSPLAFRIRRSVKELVARNPEVTMSSVVSNLFQRMDFRQSQRFSVTHKPCSVFAPTFVAECRAARHLTLFTLFTFHSAVGTPKVHLLTLSSIFENILLWYFILKGISTVQIESVLGGIFSCGLLARSLSLALAQEFADFHLVGRIWA